MRLDIDQIQQVLNQLIKDGDLESVQRIQNDLEYSEAKIKVLLYELDQTLDALTERECMFEEGNYDS